MGGIIMKITGVYIIKNKVNNLVYVGQSVDIMCRWWAHKQAAKNEKNQTHYTQIHQAMKKLGIDNFYIEVLEECEYQKLSEREIYWIAFYDSYNNGYNMTLGGESNRGETNGRAILTQADVEDIRMAYNNHIRFKDVYEKYAGTISKRGLQKVWHFETWKHILPEVYTEENRKWHATAAKANTQTNKTNQQKACTEQEIAYIRELRAKGFSYTKISGVVHRSESVIHKYCLFQESKNPNKSCGIVVKNVETGLVFDSFTSAAKWAQCDRHTLSNNINTEKTAGVVPTTNALAHWISL